MASIGDVLAAIAEVAEVDREVRLLIEEIEQLGSELAKTATSRQDRELVNALREIEPEVHKEMDVNKESFEALGQDFEQAQRSGRQEHIQQALESARLAKLQLVASRASL